MEFILCMTCEATLSSRVPKVNQWESVKAFVLPWPRREELEIAVHVHVWCRASSNANICTAPGSPCLCNSEAASFQVQQFLSFCSLIHGV